MVIEFFFFIWIWRYVTYGIKAWFQHYAWIGSPQKFYRKQQTNSCLFFLENPLTKKREAQKYFAGNMADAGMSAEEERHPKEGNLRDGEFWVDLNES